MTGLLLAAAVLACGTAPALAVGGMSPSTPFLIPLAAALVAGIGGVGEFLAAGSFAVWLAAAALAANVAAGAVLVARRRPGRRRGGRRAGPDWLEAAVVAAASAWPLAVLAAPIIGYDTQAIWLPHAAMVYAGHATLVRDLTNPLYAGSNPDYPPLAPAAMAVGYLVGGKVDQHLAVVVVAVLNACATGLAASGLLRLLPDRLPAGRRLGCLAVVAGLCGAVFGVGGQFAVNGYADVLWATAAASAVVFGLLLPPERRNLAVGGFCLAVAALTKNEGLATSLVIGVLMAWRVWRPAGGIRDAIRALVLAGLPFIPAAVWQIAVRLRHIADAFFASRSGQAAAYRLGATVPAMWDRLYLFPVALAVALAGRWVLGSHRRSLGIGPSLLLWIVAAWAVLALVVTYTFGSLRIHWWLATSVNRTTIFTNLVFLLDMVTWTVVALAGAGPPPAGRHFAGRRSSRTRRPSRSHPVAAASSAAAVARAIHRPQVHAAGS